jgi:ankyrin repeat protein
MIRSINNILLGICVFFVFSCGKPTVADITTAVSEKNYEKVEELLEQGVPIIDPAMEDNPLVISIRRNDTKMIELLVKHEINPNVTYQNESLLQWAIKKRDMKIIELLIDNGADVNYSNPDGYSVFSYAIPRLSDEELNIFIENGLDLMGHSKGNNSDISYFEDLLICNKLRTAMILLENKEVLAEVINDSDMSIKLVDYWDAGTKDLADFLIANGLRLNHDLPLLQHAINNYEATKWLLDHGVSPVKEYLAPRATDFERTPLTAAYFGLYMTTTYAQLDGTYVENTPDEMERRRVIELLEKRIAEMSVSPSEE